MDRRLHQAPADQRPVLPSLLQHLRLLHRAVASDPLLPLLRPHLELKVGRAPGAVSKAKRRQTNPGLVGETRLGELPSMRAAA